MREKTPLHCERQGRKYRTSRAQSIIPVNYEIGGETRTPGRGARLPEWQSPSSSASILDPDNFGVAGRLGRL
jgi:hypothetical protein